MFIFLITKQIKFNIEYLAYIQEIYHLNLQLW
jgi:hypothetical protein